MITFMQFLENVEDKSQKDSLKNYLQLNISEKGWYANVSSFDPKKIQSRLDTWTKYIKLDKADQEKIREIVNSKSAKLIDLFNAFYKKISRETEESAPPSPKS